jgi:hypothetical protein
MTVYRFTLAGAAAIATIAISTASMAGDYRQHGHHNRSQGVIGGNGLPSVVPGVGTFAGSIAAVRIKGSGIYFYRDGAARPTVVSYKAPKARIIEISEDAPDAACSFEAGVCVIRP